MDHAFCEKIFLRVVTSGKRCMPAVSARRFTSKVPKYGMIRRRGLVMMSQLVPDGLRRSTFDKIVYMRQEINGQGYDCSRDNEQTPTLPCCTYARGTALQVAPQNRDTNQKLKLDLFCSRTECYFRLELPTFA